MRGVVNSDARPQWAVMPTPGELQLSVDPNAAQTFTARLALTISDPVTRDGYPEFPQWTYDKHSETMLSGLLGRMMSQPAKPYTNMQLSVYHMRRFRDGIALAKVEASATSAHNPSCAVTARPKAVSAALGTMPASGTNSMTGVISDTNTHIDAMR